MMNNFSSEWINQLESNRHWNYYWHQIRKIYSVVVPGDTILEIGVGTRFTSNYLKSKGFNVVTIDIDPVKKPDIVADITTHDFNMEYEHVIGFEVFEHIPFEDFMDVVDKLHVFCRKYLIMSLPRNEKVWLDTHMEFPGGNEHRFRIATKRNRIISQHHYWEIDYQHYSNTFLKNALVRKGFYLEDVEKVNSLFFYLFKKQ